MNRLILTFLLAILSFGVSSFAQRVHIHSIDELNRKSGKDTHLKENRYRLEPDFRTIVELGKDVLGFPKLHYPRIKKLKDGSYILFYQSSRIGYSCYCAYSKDGINWEKGGAVFKGHKIVNSAGEQNDRAYSTVDAVVLDNGDILAFVSYRAVKGYKRLIQDDGLSMKRSTDGGRTWGEEQILYTTITWEPYALQLPSGEVQVYFTDSDHDWSPPSSGVTMLRSFDRGHTWQTNRQVIRQYRATATRVDGKPGTRKVWTDQMPSVVLLGDGKTLLAAVESQDSTNHFKITLVEDKTNFATTLTGDMVGPPERVDNFRSGGGPYLVRFPSGEIALSFQGNYFNIKLGLSTMNSIVKGPPYQPFGQKRSLWGSMEVIDPHTMFAVAPHLDQKTEYGTIMIGKQRLNHRIDAPFMRANIDGDNIEWGANTDALFLGSDSQAQCSFRFAYDDSTFYILVEYLDEELIPRDKIVLKFCDGFAQGDVFEATIKCAYKGLEVSRNVYAKTYEEPGRGYLVEMAIPISELPFNPDKRIFFFGEIHKIGVLDTFTLVPESNRGQWMPIKLAL